MYVRHCELGEAKIRRMAKDVGLLPLAAPTFVPVDASGIFVLMSNYTGKEVV
jgi:hypothetical protein